MAIDESGHSMVDFDLSESKFTVGGFINTGESPLNVDKSNLVFSKQGSDSQLLSAIKKKDSSQGLNRSGNLNKSNGGPEDELAMSINESDFGLSESNFSHSMMTNKFNQFAASGVSATQQNENNKNQKQQNEIQDQKQETPSFVKANLLPWNRERAGTQINPKPYKMSKNLIIEDDEDLVDEIDVIISNTPKDKANRGGKDL